MQIAHGGTLTIDGSHTAGAPLVVDGAAGLEVGDSQHPGSWCRLEYSWRNRWPSDGSECSDDYRRRFTVEQLECPVNRQLGDGALDIEAGGLISSTDGYIGVDAGGSATVAGAGSQWNNSGWLLVGTYSNGFQLRLNQEFLIADVGGSSTGQLNGLGEITLVGNFGGMDLFISYTRGTGNAHCLHRCGTGHPWVVDWIIFRRDGVSSSTTIVHC